MDPLLRYKRPELLTEGVVIISGHDSYGPWRMATSETVTGQCSVCGQEVHCILRYWQLHLPQDIPVSKTLLKRTRNPIGMDCGDYAKLMRQIIHIAESGLRKGFPV